MRSAASPNRFCQPLAMPEPADLVATMPHAVELGVVIQVATAEAVEESGMEYGGITPIGLPSAWPLLVDRAVTTAGPVIVGSGVRRSKLALDGAALGRLQGAEVRDGLGTPT